MPRTIRVYWRHATSQWYNFNWYGVINRKSVVHISVGEGIFPRFPAGIYDIDIIDRHRGEAVICVRNIVPHQDGVEFRLEVNWPTPLDVITDITVFDPPETCEIV